MFATTIKETPVLNRNDFKQLFSQTVVWDETYHARYLETILFPQTDLKVKKIECCKAQIEIDSYPAEIPLYADVRFLKLSKEKPLQRKPKKFSEKEMINRLLSLVGRCYLLGGNSPKRVFDWAKYYPPPAFSDPFTLRHWVFDGIDCSGLSYYMTDGYLPRNTSWLYEFGEDVSSLKPLDLIVYPGHVLIALDDRYVIESKAYKGVVITKWSNRKKEIATYNYRIKRWKKDFVCFC